MVFFQSFVAKKFKLDFKLCATGAFLVQNKLSSVRHGADLKSFDKCMQYNAGNKTQSNTDLH